MKYLSIYLLLFVSLVACNSEEKTEKKTYKYNYESVADDPTNTLIYTLENGLKVYLSVNKQEPRVQTYIAVKAGSKFDPAETTGLAHYLEHMVFKGTDKIGTKDWESEKLILDQIAATYEQHRLENDPKIKENLYAKIDSLSFEASKFAIANEYDKMISSLGAKGTNAYTSFDETVYINEIPSNEVEKWIKVESERFQTLVLRLFHTELETVYEEFNRSQDSDNRWVYQNVLKGLFPNHPYGTQTTIGEGEHLKNPSMYNIYEYFDNYYRPNNVAICMAGDLNPDETIDLIKQYFSGWESKPIPEFEQPNDTELTEVTELEIFGPQQELVYVGYKFDGAGSQEAQYLQMVDMILANSQAGLIDIDLNLNQKVLSAGSYPSILNDHSIHFLYGLPKEGQTLEQVKDLLIAEIEKVKTGDFDEWLVEAVVNDLKLGRMKEIESNRGRANLMKKAFINDIPFEDVIFEYDQMEDVTKEAIVKFANNHYNNNYVVSYKRIGESDRHSVPKPKITTIELDRESKSDFSVAFDSLTSEPIQAKFIDFQKDIHFSEISKTDFAYVNNENNQIFSLYYIFDMGSENSKELALAIQYLPFLGTEKYSAEALSKEFYRLGLSFDVSVSSDRIYVSLTGLEENLNNGLQLFEHVLANVVPNENAYVEMINDVLKSRKDAKLDKGTILRNGLANYAKYGEKNPFTDRMSEEELRNVDINVLTAQLKNLLNFKHRIFYYGNQKPKKVEEAIASAHSAGAQKDYPPALTYTENDFTDAKVYFVPYDMQQVELLLLSKDEQFNPNLIASANLFNEYFGAGLSSIVFQEIREQKALAYSAYAYYSTPSKADENHYVNAYIGTQADKLEDAVTAMFEIMNEMPEAEMQFNSAKHATIKKLESNWITGASIYWQYEKAKKLGLDYDIRKIVYDQVQNMTMQDLEQFFEQHIKGQQYSICVIGNDQKLDAETLKKLGEYRELELEEVFGY